MTRLTEDQTKQLLEAATAVSQYAYSPYSNLRIGAAILTSQGEVFSGTNIENISFGLTICAERAAIFNAVSSGVKSFEAMAIVSNDPKIFTPCGACRQVLMEFAPNALVICANKHGKTKSLPISELLPETPALF